MLDFMPWLVTPLQPLHLALVQQFDTPAVYTIKSYKDRKPIKAIHTVHIVRTASLQ